MDSLKRIRGFLALSLALLLGACWPPPFNLSVSSSAKTARMLSYVGQVGPIDSNSVMLGTQGTEDVVFLPEKDGAGGITIQAGFILSMDPLSGQQVNFVANNGSQYVRYGSAQGLGPLSTDPYPNFLVQSVKSAHNAIAFQFNDVTMNNQFGLMTGNPGTSTFTGPAWFGLSAQTFTDFPPDSYNAIGVSITPTNNVGFDRAYMLLADTFTGQYLEARYRLWQAANGLTFPFALRGGAELDLVGNGILPAGLSRVLYYYDSNSTNAYAMWNQGSAWTCVKWNGIPVGGPLPGIDHRIDALLTTGELFSTEGNTGRVYDPTTPTGSLEATFPLNDLRFIGEVYVGGTATMLFSEALWYGRQVSFNVYSISTAQIKTLGQ